MITLSVLDQSPILSESGAETALQQSLELAQLTDRLGYRRYWLAEHHGTHGLAGSAPEILISHIAAKTSRIRVGSGGIMLPHYSAFKIAEQFRVLACLYPGRIDLGVGRAPGGTPASTIALKRSRREMRPDDFPEQLVELLGWIEDGFGDPHPFRQLEATPVPIVAPEPWLLSSSGYGADAAAQLGVGLCFAHFINPVDAASSLRRYRASYVPSARHPKPSAALAVSVICAPTDEAAEELAMPLALWRLRLRTGDPGPVPSLEEALAFSPSPDEELMLDAARSRVVVGAPDRVVAMLEQLADTCGVDEVLAVTIAHDHSARLRSYELLGEAAGITPAEHAEHPGNAEHPGIGAAAAASLPQMARARLAR